MYSVPEEQTHNAPPVPGLPENTDPTQPTSTIKAKPGEVLLSNSYLPAVMQAVAYYVELIQYEPQHMTTIEPPYTVAVVGQPIQSEEFTPTVAATTQRTTTTRPQIITKPTYQTTRPTYQTTRPTYATTRPTYATTRPTYQTTRPTYATTRPTYQTTRPTYQTTRPTYPTTRPTYQTTWPTYQTTTTTQRPWYADQLTTHAHNPGNYQPSNPLYDYPTQKPQTGNLPLLSISQSQFFDWFLQMKTKQLSEMSGKL